MTITAEKCSVCRFWKHDNDPDAVGLGACRYNPPMVFYDMQRDDQSSIFPRTWGSTGWCGRFEPKLP